MPGEFVNGVGVDVEPIGVQRKACVVNHAVTLAGNPIIDRCWIGLNGQVQIFCIHQHKLGGIPKLVAEVAIALNSIDVEAHVAPGCGQCREGEAQGIGAVGGNAFGKVFAGLLFDARGHLWLGKIAGALCHQTLKVDAVDKVQRVESVPLGF